MQKKDKKIRELYENYSVIKPRIKNRIKSFKGLYKKRQDVVFYELCFCLLTPQSKAVLCWQAVERLKKNKLFSSNNSNIIKSALKSIRFHNNKADYIKQATAVFARNGKFAIKDKININDIKETRRWFAKNIKGLGYKEASHFLRNVGLGHDIAILDRHVLKTLKDCEVIKDFSLSISSKEYLNIEDKFKEFALKINIPLEELDLLFWYNKTGYIFK